MTQWFRDIFPDSVAVMFSDREMDFSLPDGCGGFGREQQEYLASRFVPFSRLIVTRQVHGKQVLVVDNREKEGGCLPPADALVTHMPGLALSIRTADCLPVFLFDPRRKCIGLAHAGWKGSRSGIAAETVRVMRQRYGTRPGDVTVAFGPSIRSCCYEVEEYFKTFLPGAVQQREGRWYLDLTAANRDQLTGVGVRPDRIFVSDACTCCREEYFSYRRQKEKAGRHLSVMMLLPR